MEKEKLACCNHGIRDTINFWSTRCGIRVQRISSAISNDNLSRTGPVLFMSSIRPRSSPEQRTSAYADSTSPLHRNSLIRFQKLALHSKLLNLELTLRAEVGRRSLLSLAWPLPENIALLPELFLVPLTIGFLTTSTEESFHNSTSSFVEMRDLLFEHAFSPHISLFLAESNEGCL